MPRGGRGQPEHGLDGVLVVAKPTGPTSHDVVALVRRLSATRRVGHGGTLDPFASGVLPLFLGRATRIAEYHLNAPKAYRATVCFGASSTTDDLEGELTPTGTAPSRDAVAAALPRFTGPIHQRPPAYSAIKVGGRRAYAVARAGEQPSLAERDVTITRLELVEWDDDDATRPIAIVEVDCSAGTYVRALARDIGAAVGSAAYLGALVRTRSGPFALNDAVPLADVRAASAESGPEGVGRLLLPIDAGLDALPRVALDADQVRAVVEGQFVRLSAPPGVLRLVDENGALVGIGRRIDGRVAPAKILVERPRRVDAVEAALAAELDPPASVDPDPATPDG
jgi:tRNA pseudouridine55 synthase